MGTYAFNIGTLSAGNNYTLTLGGSVTFRINQAQGANVNTVTLESVGSKSLTVTAASLATATGQSIQYAINTADSPPISGWQSSRTFGGLSDRNYYIYARSVGSDTSNYAQGTAMRVYTANAAGWSGTVILNTSSSATASDFQFHIDNTRYASFDAYTGT